MSVIRTKYLGPTNTKGGRIKAMLASESITLPYDYDGSGMWNHEKTAYALARKLNLKGQWGRVWDQSQSDGFLFVCLDDADPCFIP